MIDEIETLKRNIDEYKSSKNPFKRIFAKFLYRKIKNSLNQIINKTILDKQFIIELQSFVSLNSNNIFKFKNFPMEDIVYIYNIDEEKDLHETIEIRIDTHRLSSANSIECVYYPYKNPFDGKISKLYKYQIDTSHSVNKDVYSVKIESIIKKCLFKLFDQYLG